MEFARGLLLAQQEGEQVGLGGPEIIFLLVYLALIVVAIAGMWKVFVKAGKPGWAVIVPIYNLIVLLEIIGKPIWWIVLFLIPCVNFVMGIVLAIEMAKVFGKGTGYGLGLAFLPFIFYPLLSFGDAKYQGPSAS